MTNSRSVPVALIVLIAVLVAVAQPAAAADANLEIASRHTDFGTGDEAAPQVLDSMQVAGSGDSATVQYDGSLFSDGFEDEPADAGTPESWEVVDSNGISEEVTTDRASAGSQSYNLSDVDGSAISRVRPQEQPYSSARTANISADLYVSRLGDKVGFEPRDGGTQMTLVVIRNGDLQYFDGSWNTISTAPDAGEWVSVKIHDIDASANTFSVTWSDSAGNSGTATGLGFRNDVAGYDEAILQADDADVFVDEYQIGEDGDGEYLSAVHSVDRAEAATVNVSTLTDASATLNVSTASGATLNETTVSSAGNYTLSFSETSDDLVINITVTPTGDSPALELEEESVLFDAVTPSGTLDSPQDGAELTESSVDFTVQVNDSDFSTAQGDTVEAVLYVDGEQAGSQTVSSNTTVTVTETISSGGNHTYHWELTDSYGESITTQTRELATPSEIRLYSETNSSRLLDNTTFNVTMYFENETGPAIVEERTVSDGTVNLSGLPAGESFVVAVEGDGWVNRRIVVPSIYEQSGIYMLNSSVETVPVVFKLEDFTGDFPQGDTVLLVQRGINGTYDTVLGDSFGATGQFPATLASGARHRLVLLNTETGQRRIVGEYTPLAGGEQTITVSPDGGIRVDEVDPTVTWIPGTELLPATENTTLGAELNNQSATIDNWNITVVHVPENSSNTTLWTYTDTTNGGREVRTENLSGLAGQIRLEVGYELQSDRSASVVQFIDLQEQYDQFSYSLLGQLESAPSGLLPAGDVDAATTAIAVFLSVIGMAVVATSTGTTSELTAGTGVLMLAAFSVIGWVGYGLVTVSGVAWLGLTAVRRGVV